METLVFESALGHVAVARQAATSGPLTVGSTRIPGSSAAARQAGRLLALAFGHTSERAALKALAKTLERYMRTNCAPPDSVPPNSVYVSSVYAGNDAFVDRLCAFALGEAERFDDLEIDVSHLTPFGRKVTATCRQIGWGKTLTYGELAKRVGRPGAARAVGSVMARNHLPLIVPCHRVVAAGGGLGGYSAPQGVAMKQRLLEMEQRAAVPAV